MIRKTGVAVCDTHAFLRHAGAGNFSSFWSRIINDDEGLRDVGLHYAFDFINVFCDVFRDEERLRIDSTSAKIISVHTNQMDPADVESRFSERYSLEAHVIDMFLLFFRGTFHFKDVPLLRLRIESNDVCDCHDSISHSSRLKD